MKTILNIDYEYDKNIWVYPEYIYYTSSDKSATTKAFLDHHEMSDIDYKKIPNKGLKVLADFTEGNYTRTYWYWGYLMTQSEGLGFLINGKIYNIKIENSNLLVLLQTRGIENGFLKGTYKLSEVGSSGKFRLIPEDTEEDKVKSKITDVYWDKTIKFTTKMIPGHLYVSKSKYILLCLASNLDYYSDNIEYFNYNLPLSSSIVHYSEKPVKTKLLINISTPDTLKGIMKKNVKSIQDIIINAVRRPCMRSNNIAGKDLGPFLIDDGRSIECCVDLIKEEDMFSSYYFINNLFLLNSNIKQEIKKFLVTNDGFKFKHYNPIKYSVLKSKLKD